MGFFATFWTWLNAQLGAYIGDNTARLAGVLEPTIVSLATIYVMGWGYLHLIGKLEEPVVAGLKRLIVMAVVLGVSLRLWLYNTLIVDTFYNAPAQLAAAVVGATDPVATIDAIWQSGGTVAGNLWAQDVGLFGMESTIVGAVVWLVIGILCVYSMFLIALSSIALAVLLALGPIFIALLMFESTKRFFAAWLGQLANYALITILTIMLAALLLQIVNSYAAQTAARGSSILSVDALNMMLIAALVLLVLRQVMPIAAGLSGGFALNSMGLVSRSLAWGLRGGWVVGKPVAKVAAPLVAQTVIESAGGARRAITGDYHRPSPPQARG